MIILGLGSNIGDRVGYLESAIHYLSESVLSITAISPIYESPALLKADASEEWDIKYLNMAIMGETHLSPQVALMQIKRIEKKVGRQVRGLWAPREIDIDILAYDSITINESNLTIPHMHLCERSFALLPLNDIAPNWRYPAEGECEGKTAYEMAQVFAGSSSIHKTAHKLNLKNKQLVA